MRFLRVFDSLKFVRAIFVAVVCAFFIFPAKSDDCVVTKIFQGEQYTEENRLEKTLMSSSGTMSTNTNYYVTDYIPLKAGDYRFTIKDNGTGNRPVNIILYDKNNVIISNPVSATTNTSLQTFNFNVPTDCFARISARNTTTNKTLQPVNPITYTEPCIKIATTHYNETKFAPVETDLNAARTVINDLITQMQTNAINVSKLAVEKQTRPNADCPAGKNCLLVIDPTGAENWYVIAGAGDVETPPADYFAFTVIPYMVSYDKYDDNGDYVESVENEIRFAFGMNPSGTFTIDWGDGTAPQVVNRPNVTYLYDSASQYSHVYADGNPKTIRITGRATGYSTNDYEPVLFFEDEGTGSSSIDFITSIDGSLGAIFPTLGNGTGQQPNFAHLFEGASVTSIPAGLFSGVTGAAEGMFISTFDNTQITSIPAGLFSGVTGAARGMFEGTFYGTRITSIPENLFSGVTGAADYMFHSTFAGTRITSIPENLFRGVTGAAEGMFDSTFGYCENLSGYIPESTFAGLIQNNSPDASDFMSYIFDASTGLATTCPQNTTEVSTPYKSKYWSIGNGNAVMCRPN